MLVRHLCLHDAAECQQPQLAQFFRLLGLERIASRLLFLGQLALDLSALRSCPTQFLTRARFLRFRQRATLSAVQVLLLLLDGGEIRIQYRLRNATRWRRRRG